MKNTIKTDKNLTILLNDDASIKDQKNKNSIDKKLKKIETLKKQIENTKKKIETIKILYKKHIDKEEQLLFMNKEKLIGRLYERFKHKSFLVWQKELLEGKILNEIQFLTEKGFQSEMIHQIHEEILQLQNEKMDDFEKEMMNDMTKEYLKSMGIEIDEDNFDYKDFMNPNSRAKFEQDFARQYSKERETQKHADQAEKIKTTDKDFQKLYRTLVKKVHPDLVIDPKEKEQREEWMKKLSQAWEHRNYYELLILQKEIEVDSTTETMLGSSQLKLIIQQLNQEINTLDTEKHILQREHPETAFYYENFSARSEKGMLKKIEEFKSHLQSITTETIEEFEMLKTQKATKELLSIIRDQQDDFDDVFDDVFEGVFDDDFDDDYAPF